MSIKEVTGIEHIKVTRMNRGVDNTMPMLRRRLNARPRMELMSKRAIKCWEVGQMNGSKLVIDKKIIPGQKASVPNTPMHPKNRKTPLN